MAKNKKAKKEIPSAGKSLPPSVLTGEEIQHLIANAIVEADELREVALHKQQDTELLEWRTAIGYKEFSDKSKFIRDTKTFLNRLRCFVRLCFVSPNAIKGDRASFALTKLFLRLFFDLAKWITGMVSLLFVIYGICSFFISEQPPAAYLSDFTILVLGITIFTLSRMLRMASIEIEKIEDRNYLFGLFASVTALVSTVIAVIAFLKGG